jgi:hypothetical protein
MQPSPKSAKFPLIFLVGMLFAACAADSQGQEKHLFQTAGVDNTKMGAYRTLAEISFQAFHKGDLAMAAKLARVLERTWDAAEEGGGERSLGKTNPELFEQIDGAMDAFIKPLIGFEKTPADPLKVETAYTAFLEKLRAAD